MRLFAFLAVLVAAIVLIAPVAAHGQTTYYFVVDGSGDWNTTANWKTACTNGSAGQVPTEAQNAVICDGATAQVTNTTAECRTLSVLDGSSLEIVPQTGSAATLTVGNTTGSPPLEDFILGSLTLKTPANGHHATLAFVSAPHVVQGGSQGAIIGEIEGEDDDAAITVAVDQMFTSSDLLIHGKLQIKGEGSFVNEGTVEADANGTLAVKVEFEIDDTAGANRWKATTPPSGNSRLLFTGDLLSFDFGVPLSGDFVISNANAEIQVDDLTNFTTFGTTGRLNMSAGMFDILDNVTMGSPGAYLNMTGGQIIVAAGKTFTHN